MLSKKDRCKKLCSLPDSNWRPSDESACIHGSHMLRYETDVILGSISFETNESVQ